MKKSGYKLGKRAEQQEQTRQRIVAATAELHEELGPAATTISGVAERAGVQRLTVYRHFPDETELFAACSAHTANQHPPPDPELWSGIEDPEERAEAALRLLYAYYTQREQALANVLRDAERLPALQAALTPMREYLGWVAEGLATGFRLEPPTEGRLRIALAHALEFWTWRSLAAHGLDSEEAAGLMLRFVRAAAEG